MVFGHIVGGLIGDILGGIADGISHRFGPFLQVFDSVHGRSLNLLRLPLDLVADITGQLTSGRFEFTFLFFGFGISWVGHGVDL